MKEIYAAFVKAHKAFSPALKTSSNPHFKSKYAALDACVEAVMDALNANGIALIQKTHQDDSGVTVETTFIHESGESMSAGTLHFPASKHDAQGFMSALTYCRRGSLMAACGIAPEDDDGNAAVKSVKKRGGLSEIGDDFPAEDKKWLQDAAEYVSSLVKAGKTDSALDYLTQNAVEGDASLYMQRFLDTPTKKALGMVFVKAA